MTGARRPGRRVLLRRPEERNQRVVRASVEREKEKTGMREYGMARKRGERRGRAGEGRWAREGGSRGLWMSGRQCRDAKGGIEVSLAPRGGEQSGMSE